MSMCFNFLFWFEAPPKSDLPGHSPLAQNLFAGSGPKEAELTKSKSRFEILDDRQLRSRSKKSMKNNSQGASVAKGKSFFGTLDSDEEDEDEDEEEEEKPGLTGSKSGSGGMKKNKVSPAY